jgi:hypothetical protein
VSLRRRKNGVVFAVARRLRRPWTGRCDVCEKTTESVACVVFIVNIITFAVSTRLLSG